MLGATRSLRSARGTDAISSPGSPCVWRSARITLPGSRAGTCPVRAGPRDICGFRAPPVAQVLRGDISSGDVQRLPQSPAAHGSREGIRGARQRCSHSGVGSGNARLGENGARYLLVRRASHRGMRRRQQPSHTDPVRHPICTRVLLLHRIAQIPGKEHLFRDIYIVNIHFIRIIKRITVCFNLILKWGTPFRLYAKNQTSF